MEIFLILFPTTAIFAFLLGIYYVFYASKLQAKETVQGTLAAYRQMESEPVRKFQSNLLKPKTPESSPKAHKLELQLERANLLISPTEFTLISIGAFAVVFVLYLAVTGNVFMAFLLGALAYFLPIALLRLKIFLRMKRAEEDFPNILDAVVNCFKTGYGFNRAVQVIANNYDDPWGTEFGKMSIELNLGNTMEEVMANLKRRIPTVDVELFAAAILMQKETGGNLAEILSILSNTCRERFKLFRKIASLTAQGKLSASIVSCVPFLIMYIMYLVTQESAIEFVTNPIGMAISAVALIWMSLGVAVLFKLVQLEV